MIKEHTNIAPLVSIITPLYNAEKFITQTLESVKNQTYSNWEHIIVDDASIDNGVVLVQKVASIDSRIRLIVSKTNQGAASSRNQATQIAKGEYIAFLDSDDLWHPEKLEKQIAFMQVQDCYISYTSYLHMDEKGSLLNKRVIALPQLNFKKQHRNNYIGNLTGIYNASRIGKIIAPNIRKRQDWAVWLEAIKKSDKPALGIQEDLAYYRVREDSISANKIHLIKYNFLFYRKYLEYSWLKSVGCLLVFFWEYFMVRPKHIENY